MKTCVLAIMTALVALGETKLGAPLKLKEPMTVDAVLKSKDSMAGQAVQVKGKATEVCQMMGCWVNLVSESGKMIQFNAHEAGLVFPKDSVGKQVIAEGTLVKSVMSKQEAIAAAKHEAEEQGRKFNPNKIKSGKTVYSIQGAGAVLLD